ncbi:putative transposase [Accumulibacter sp.]|jgi:hypothetical protein|uniref:putative transposase n=1 Tax=Accumulibacter sp. TaxID=2053492 RepID=UPI001AD28A01|nr:hypothetical protein [Accumulibacter sp.]MBN8453959.1 hypothetical protein [Accumulibacter sp.]MBO3708715.1 hypothetical protein [Candidatus Accumulibacter conexus]
MNSRPSRNSARTPRHLDAKDLPEESRLSRLSTEGRQLLDTPKMIASRAETAMANVLAPLLARPDEVRSLLSAIDTTAAGLLPDPQTGTLTGRFHHLSNGVSDRAVRTLRDELNATEAVFPRPNLRWILQLGPSQKLGDQVVGAFICLPAGSPSRHPVAGE